MPAEVHTTVTKTDTYYGDHGDLILQGGWDDPGAMTQEKTQSVYNQIVSTLNSQGYSFYGDTYQSNYDKFIAGSGKRYRAVLNGAQKEFEFHIIVE